MKSGLLFVVLSAVLFSGCRTQSRVNQQLLERELRLQEDCIWKLKWALEDQQRALDDARQQMETYRKEADALRGKTATGPDLSPPSSILAPAEGGGRDSEAPRLPPAPIIERGTEVDPRSLQPPTTAPSGPGGGGSGQTDPPRSRTESSGPALTQATAIMPETAVQRPIDSTRTPERLNPDLTIDRIVLDEKASGGLNLDGKPGDELLSVAIEQRDENDKRIIAPGDVSIVVVDPAIDGKASKIARWDFDAEEAAKCIRRSRDGATMQFELPWPKQPVHSDLRLFVRFTTYDGRKLEANLPIEVQLAGGAWTKSRVALAAHEENAGNDSTSDEETTLSEPPPRARSSKWSPDR